VANASDGQKENEKRDSPPTFSWSAPNPQGEDGAQMEILFSAGG